MRAVPRSLPAATSTARSFHRDLIAWPELCNYSFSPFPQQTWVKAVCCRRSGRCCLSGSAIDCAVRSCKVAGVGAGVRGWHSPGALRGSGAAPGSAPVPAGVRALPAGPEPRSPIHFRFAARCLCQIFQACSTRDSKSLFFFFFLMSGGSSAKPRGGKV